MVDNITGIATMQGEAFRRWQRACARAFQYVRLDDDRDRAQTDG